MHTIYIIYYIYIPNEILSIHAFITVITFIFLAFIHFFCLLIGRKQRQKFLKERKKKKIKKKDDNFNNYRK